MTNYLERSCSSIQRACALVNGGKVDLYPNLCQLLIKALKDTDKFLQQRSSALHVVQEKRREALLQLYFVVQQAEILVQKCCGGQRLSWPRRALVVLGMKQDIVLIVLDLRWWESILDIVIASTGSEIVLLRSANQNYRTALTKLTSSDSALQQASVRDEGLLVQKIDELLESYSTKPGTIERCDYLLSIQVRFLVTDEEVGLTPSLISELNQSDYQSPIGNGSFGQVLHVMWYENDCALKVFDKLRPDRNEGLSLNACRHPHVVQFFRYWEEESRQTDAPARCHMLTERMPSDLAKHLPSIKASRSASSSSSRRIGTNLPSSNPVAIDIMLQLAKAMWHMHNKRSVHRDLKPGNVLLRRVTAKESPELSERGFVHVKLADFGLARGDLMSSNDDVLSHKAGSSLYRAPELSILEYVHGHNYPRKADVWSFGIMGAEIVSGDRPYPSNVLMAELNPSIKKGLRPRLPKDCPDYLKICLENCWKYRPEDRPRFSEIWEKLRFAKLRSLGIIEQNYDLFRFGDNKDHLERPSPSRSTVLGKLQAFAIRLILKMALARESTYQAPYAHLKSPIEKPWNFFGNQVWPPEDSPETITSDTPGIDIIFFEGNVGGRPLLSGRDTWLVRKKPHACWPQDWLPYDVERHVPGKARVLVLDYCISDGNLQAVVEKVKQILIFSEKLNPVHAWKRPVVLVGHSLGCTIIETLVTNLHQSVQEFDPKSNSGSASLLDVRKFESSKAFLNILAGCFFYAPPFERLIASSEFLEYVFGGLEYSDELFQTLPLGPMKDLVRITKSRNIKLMALIEGHQTKGRFVVPRNSHKDLGIECLELEESTHSCVCKPVDKMHPSYRTLMKFIVACTPRAS